MVICSRVRVHVGVLLSLVFALGFASAACDEDEGDGGGGGEETRDVGGAGADSAGSDATGGNGAVDPTVLASSNDGVPCGQILDCYELCNGGGLGQSCIDECFASGTETGRTKLLALSGCYDDNGCDNQDCLRLYCQGELDECEYDQPAGGVVCISEGVYEYCDLQAGWCEDRTVTGAAWGGDEGQGGFWSNYDCGDNLNAAIIIDSFGDLTRATWKRDCQVVRCEAQ